MANQLLQPPTSTNPEQSLYLTQQAPNYLSSQRSVFSTLPAPLNTLFTSESQEKWQIHENILLASLRTGDLELAKASLSALQARFGASNERIQSLEGLYREGSAKTAEERAKAMEGYEKVLKEDPTAFAIRKRRAALLRAYNLTPEAVTALVSLLETSPIDAEAWAELADVYFAQGALELAVYCLEEVVLVTPNAWNMHARLGEVGYLAAIRADKGSTEQMRGLAESLRRFCRAIELCDDYLRGFYGLKLSCLKFLELIDIEPKKVQQAYASSTPAGELALIPVDKVRKLDELATWRLSDILRMSAQRTPGWDGYSEAELIAARELLDRQSREQRR